MSLASPPCRLLPALAGLLLVAQPVSASRIDAVMQVSAGVIAICQNVQASDPARQQCSVGVSYQLHRESRESIPAPSEKTPSSRVEVVRIRY